MAMQIPEWVKPGLWGVVIGAGVLAIVEFGAGWVVTSDTARDMVTRQTEKAVIASLTPICVAQFKSASQQERTTYLAALQKEDSWKRADYVEKQGWATMPGSAEPNKEVADACASELLKLVKK